ncbi:MAG: M23 family metallopeptidase [Actinobacteria bacterium]|nr:M23 family metallopeptidase [Actinomycetota bacterium]
MKPFLLLNLWSFKREIKYIVVAFLIILALPIIAVFILVNAGIDVVSDHLATSNPTTNTVTIHDPTGDVSKDQEVVNPMEWPVHGVITLEFGENDFPYQILHTGIDIANPYGQIGDPVTPFMEGKVTYAGEIFWGYGKHIIIDSGNNVTSLYGHLDKIYVYKGETVHLGQIIGKEGTTGWSTGPHLHFEVRVYGIPVNPRTFLGNANP